MKINIKNKEVRKVIYGKKSNNLLSILRENKIEVNNNCGAKGKCGKCKVKILKYNSLKITKSDEKYLSKEELEQNIRLACMIYLQEDEYIEIELINNNDDIHTLTDIHNNNINLDTNIKKYYIELEKPTLIDQMDYVKKISNHLNIDLEINIKDLQNLSEVIEENDYKVTLTTYNNQLIHIQGGDRSKYKYGIAIDLGTTTVALYLVDLNNGNIISITSQANKQRAYGGDVISRINYTMENKDGIDELNKCVISQINEMIDKISKENNIDKKEIYNLVLVGNTTMIHLFMKLNCKNIAIAPFIPIITETYKCPSSDLGININGIISFPPSISAYVGSDISAGILASKLYEHEKFSLLLDIGTNGEMALGNKDVIFTCSTAAGPAFEGANIKYGVGGIDGAISSIDLSKSKIYETINNERPCGICGSGVLDISSQLLKYEIIDENGRMYDLDEIKDDNLRKRLKIENNMKEFVIFEDEDKKISFTQKDIREVQLAKAAICAGIKVLLKESNLNYENIEYVYIGGGFGNFMDVDSAINIGMIPKELKDKIKSIGNCAGKGALDYLINCDKQKDIINITNKCKYVELSQNKFFQEFYIDSITFDEELFLKA